MTDNNSSFKYWCGQRSNWPQMSLRIVGSLERKRSDKECAEGDHATTKGSASRRRINISSLQLLVNQQGQVVQHHIQKSTSPDMEGVMPVNQRHDQLLATDTLPWDWPVLWKNKSRRNERGRKVRKDNSKGVVLLSCHLTALISKQTSLSYSNRFQQTNKQEAIQGNRRNWEEWAKKGRRGRPVARAPYA